MSSEDKKLVIWVDDNVHSPSYSEMLDPMRATLSSCCELIAVNTISSFASKLQDLSDAGRAVDGILLDLMLHLPNEDRTLKALGAPTVPTRPHLAGLQVARVLLLPVYQYPDGDLAAAEFLETHRGCKVALLTTTFDDSEKEVFTDAEANEIRGMMTCIYNLVRYEDEAQTAVRAWVRSLVRP